MRYINGIEHDIFLEKLYIKSGGETIPGPFFKRAKLRISPDQQSETLCSLFLMYVLLEGNQNTLK